MPTAMTRSLGKTGFIKEFLNDNPEANTRAVNDAWRAAGFAGTISPTLVTKLRSQLGLTGNIRKGPGKKAEAEAAARPSGKRHGGRKGATGRGGNQGKTAFVTDQLRQDPDSSDEAINRAWAAAGNPGRISVSLMYQIRTREGLTGKRRSKRRGARKRGRPRSSPRGMRVERAPVPVAEMTKPINGRTGRFRFIAEVEGDLDRLIFKLMDAGGMDDIEDELRKVRRLLYRRYSAR